MRNLEFIFNDSIENISSLSETNECFFNLSVSYVKMSIIIKAAVDSDKTFFNRFSPVYRFLQNSERKKMFIKIINVRWPTYGMNACSSCTRLYSF